jgi:hypothetical protein
MPVIGAQISNSTPPLVPYNYRPQPASMPPLVPVGRGVKPIGLEESQAREKLNTSTNAAFTDFYSKLKQNPQEMLKFVPSGDNSGINGMGANVPLTADELEGRQKAMVREHFMAHVAPGHPDLAGPNQDLMDAQKARMEGRPLNAVKNERIQRELAEKLAQQPPSSTRVVTGPKGTTTTTEYKPPVAAKPPPPSSPGTLPTPGTPGTRITYNGDGTIKGAVQTTPNPPATRPAAATRPAPAVKAPAAIPPGFDHNPTSAEISTWRMTVLDPWLKAKETSDKMGSYGKDPGQRPEPPWMKQPVNPNMTDGAAGVPRVPVNGPSADPANPNMPPAAQPIQVLDPKAPKLQFGGEGQIQKRLPAIRVNGQEFNDLGGGVIEHAGDGRRYRVENGKIVERL